MLQDFINTSVTIFVMTFIAYFCSLLIIHLGTLTYAEVFVLKSLRFISCSLTFLSAIAFVINNFLNK